MNNKVQLIIFYFLILVLSVSCIDKHFIVYSITGQELRYEETYRETRGIADFKLYFSKDDIDTQYSELNIIATDYFYYGQFFFDNNFMSMLKSKTLHIGADALIYEKHRIDFPNYNENFLYFTAIKYNNNTERK